MIPLRFFMMLTSNDHRPKQPEMPRSHAIKTVPKTEVTCPHSHYREESFRTQSVSCRTLLQRTSAQNFMGTTQNLAGSRVIFYSPRQKLSIYLWLTVLIRCWQPWWGWRNLQLKQAGHSVSWHVTNSSTELLCRFHGTSQQLLKICTFVLVECTLWWALWGLLGHWWLKVGFLMFFQRYTYLEGFLRCKVARSSLKMFVPFGWWRRR